MDALQRYHWPGNVRELKNTIERLAIMLPREEIRLLDLPMSILKAGSDPAEDDRSTWQRARDEWEREFLLKSLQENEGNVSKTAAAIGMERSHLHRKLKGLNLK